MADDDNEIPIYLKRHAKIKLPEGTDCCYLITKDGAFLYKNLGVMEAMVPVKEIPELAGQQSWARLNLEPIPMPHLAQILNFFRWVLKEKRGEAVVLLFYNPKKKIWKIEAPIQTVTGGSVRYEDGIQLGGHWLKVGTIHSHCDMAPFHSGGDQHDEMFFDGLHVTFGHISREYPGVSVQIVCNQLRFIASPEDYFAGITYGQVEIPMPTYTTKTYAPVRRVRGKRGGFRVQQLTGVITPMVEDETFVDVPGPENVVAPSTYKADGLKFQFEEDESLADYPFPEEWKEQVRVPEPPKPIVVTPIASRYTTYVPGVLAPSIDRRDFGGTVQEDHRVLIVHGYHSHNGDFVFVPKDGRIMPLDEFQMRIREQFPEVESRIQYRFAEHRGVTNQQQTPFSEFDPGED